MEAEIAHLVTHGDHGTSVSDEIDQKTKVGQNTRFFLRFFFPAHFGHWNMALDLVENLIFRR